MGDDFYQDKAVQTGTKMISPWTVPEGAGSVSESYPTLARDDLGTESLVNVPSRQRPAS